MDDTPTATADVSVEAIARVNIVKVIKRRLNVISDYDYRRWSEIERAVSIVITCGIQLGKFTIPDIRGAVARGWCAAKNADKEMDSDLAEAITSEILALFQSGTNSALPDTTSQNNAEKLSNREAAAGLPGREALVDVLHAHNDEVTREQNYMCADAILSLLSAPGGTWHGIESAPRDGKNVVLYHKIHGEMEGHFESCREWEHHELGKQYDGALWILGDDIYQEAVEEGPNGEFFDGQITHWRLPSPPSTGKGSEG